MRPVVVTQDEIDWLLPGYFPDLLRDRGIGLDLGQNGHIREEQLLPIAQDQKFVGIIIHQVEEGQHPVVISNVIAVVKV
ncbi:hypothetical protein ES708_32243 [subsurface metagenome]